MDVHSHDHEGSITGNRNLKIILSQFLSANTEINNNIKKVHFKGRICQQCHIIQANAI
jgi:hypothetical protein